MITAVLLAAGRSSRMGAAKDSKLLLPWGEGSQEPLVVGTARKLLTSGIDHIVAVTGHRADEVGAALASMGVEIVLNAEYVDGLSTSIAVGVRAAPDGSTGYLFALADMPNVATDTINAICSAFVARPTAIVAPVCNGRRGNPVLFSREFRQQLLSLSGDRGAGGLLTRYAGSVVEVEVDDDGIFADVDTAQDYRKLRNT
jgi:molybdenum cofactor cytidylyltransferase